MVQLAQLEINDETGEALARVARGRGKSVDDVLRSLLGVPDEHANANNGKQASFDRVWERVCDLAGTEFATRNGQRFSYVVDGSYVAPSTSDVRIPVSQFRKAFAIGPVRGPASFRGVFAPSIVWAVLNDERVRGVVPATASSAAVVTEATGPAEGAAAETSVAAVEGPAVAMVSHTWPDDCGADIADAPSLDERPSVQGQPIETSTQAEEAAETVAPVEQGPVQPVVVAATVTAVVGSESRLAQPVMDQEGRGFFKRIFGGR